MCLYSATIWKLEVATLQARDDLLQLEDSLCVTSIGKLSLTLTPSHNLTHIIKLVCTQLLEEATLIAQPQIEYTYIDHQVAEVHAGAIPEGIRLFIDIILKGRERYFEVYQAHSLPFFDSKISL
jgi:hypothetical protein